MLYTIVQQAFSKSVTTDECQCQCQSWIYIAHKRKASNAMKLLQNVRRHVFFETQRISTIVGGGYWLGNRADYGL